MILQECFFSVIDLMWSCFSFLVGRHKIRNVCMHIDTYKRALLYNQMDAIDLCFIITNLHSLEPICHFIKTMDTCIHDLFFRKQPFTVVDIDFVFVIFMYHSHRVTCICYLMNEYKKNKKSTKFHYKQTDLI